MVLSGFRLKTRYCRAAQGLAHEASYPFTASTASDGCPWNQARSRRTRKPDARAREVNGRRRRSASHSGCRGYTRV